MQMKKAAVCLAKTLAVLLWLAMASRGVFAADGAKWFRGQMHDHTYWSDGRAFPEQAVEAYKQRGYDFLSITDHNRFAEDKNVWREVAPEEGGWPPKVAQAIFDRYVQARGKDRVETKTEGGVTSVRLRTFAELKAEFEEPGKFILLPGLELTQDVKGIAVHANCVNLPLVLPCVKGDDLVKKMDRVNTVSELIALNAAEAKQAAAALGRPYLLTLNHPFWVYYDIVPQNLIDCPEVRFFEVCNGGTSYAPSPQAPAYTVEKFWDVVNAFRAIHGQPLLYGVGSDDAHFYDAPRIDGNSGVGDAWVMVRAAAVTPENLIEAMRQGDFYATNGVVLEDVAFTPADNTLRVAVKAEEGVHYHIRFVTTKRNFDQKVTTIASPAEDKRPARSIPVYSEDIGRTANTVSGVKAEYRLEPDDLYVRAVVESDRPAKTTPHFHPKTQVAWTQPYAAAKTETKAAEARKVLFLGNSITLHGPKSDIGWTGNWGMAASAEDKDYVHLVLSSLSGAKRSPSEVMVRNVATFEREYATYDVDKEFKDAREFKADLVILAIGENVPALDSEEAKLKFRDAVTKILRGLKVSSSPTIIVRSCFWPDPAKDTMLKQACAAVGGIFVDIGGLAKDEANYGRSERKFEHTGVAAHPGDRGMKAIADAILKAIRSKQE